MIQAIFRFLMNMLATLIQIIVWPINQVITSTLPDISSKINEVTTGFSSLFGGIGWALGLLPPGILPVLLFILTVEIAKHTIYVSTHTLMKVWTVLQKIKFW